MISVPDTALLVLQQNIRFSQFFLKMVKRSATCFRRVAHQEISGRRVVFLNTNLDSMTLQYMLSCYSFCRLIILSGWKWDVPDWNGPFAWFIWECYQTNNYLAPIKFNTNTNCVRRESIDGHNTYKSSATKQYVTPYRSTFMEGNEYNSVIWIILLQSVVRDWYRHWSR